MPRYVPIRVFIRIQPSDHEQLILKYHRPVLKATAPPRTAACLRPLELLDHLKAAGRPVVEDWLAGTGDKGAAVMADYRKALDSAGSN